MAARSAAALRRIGPVLERPNTFQIGVRETRRVHGLYRLTKDDVLSARQFDDQIGLCGAPIEDHHEGADTKWLYLPEGECVGIPYRTLVPAKTDNVLVAGRCFSATHVYSLLSAKDHGYRTSEMMYKWIKDGIEPPLETRTIGTLITRGTFRQVLKEQGIRD